MIEQEVNGFKRRLWIRPGWDKRNLEPTKNYGIGGMSIWFGVIRDWRAMSWTVSIPVYPSDLQLEMNQRARNGEFNNCPDHISFGALNYHRPPTEEEAREHHCSSTCEFIESACSSDGSYTAGNAIGHIFVNNGLEDVFNELELAWRERFGEV
jgi:hypothetical protein